MFPRSARLMILGVALGSTLLLARAACAAPGDAKNKDEGFPGFTKPSDKADKLGFQVAGVVAKVYVKPGQVVRKGDPLVDLDTREEEKELALLSVEADSDLPIDAAKKNYEFKKIKFERIDAMFKNNAATLLEREEAKADAEVAALQIDKARQDQLQAKIKRDARAIGISKMKKVAEMDGVVEKVDVTVGELVVPDPTKPMMSMMSNDPLWVEVHLPVAAAQMLKAGQKLAVRYPGEALKPNLEDNRTGEIIYLAPEADAASDTQVVRLAMKNVENKSSGLRVLVDLPQEVRDGLRKVAQNR